MPDRPDQPQPPADGDEKLAGASVPIDLPARLKAEHLADLPDPRISADAQQELKQAFRRELRVPPQIKLQVLAGAAHSFEQRKYRHRRIMRTQRIAAAALFMVGTALAFKYMAPGNNQLPAPQGPIAMNSAKQADAAGGTLADAQTLGESAKAKGDLAKSEMATPASPLATRSAAPAASLIATVPADLDSDGTVTILDAFALARALEPLGGRVKAGNASLSKSGYGSADLNNDGFVDDLDVEFISAQAVRLSPLAMHTGGAP
jgi:hypothetical protein